MSVPVKPEELGLWTLAEFAGMLRVSQQSIYNWLKQGRLTGVKLGGRWRFRDEDLRRFLNGGKEG